MLEWFTLGTSSAVPTSRRNLSAHLLRFQGEVMLFDCGEGTQKTLMKEQLGLMSIDRVFITHWHADHFSGLLGLVQTLGMEGRDRPLYIYGPSGTEEFTQHLLELGYYNRSYDIYTEDLSPGDVVDGDGFEVRAVKTKHGVPSLGYAFVEDDSVKASRKKMEELGLGPSPAIGKLKNGESVEIDGETITPEMIVEEVPGRKIVYTGDTEYANSVIRAAEDADLLVHEATFDEETLQKGRSGHSSAKVAATVAEKAGAAKLVLTHFSRRFDANPEVLLNEAKQVFSSTVLGEDGKKFVVKPHRPED